MDADGISFVAASRAESVYDFGETGVARSADMDAAKAEVLRWIKELQETLNADDVILGLSCKTRRYFRHDILPTYKFNRTAGPSPLLLGEVKQFLRDGTGYKTYERPALEGDDVCGILATHQTLIPGGGEKIIVSSDKDMRQVPGLTYNPRKPDVGVEYISPAEADDVFYRMILSGDATDGVKGCPGIGPVRAQKILFDAARGWVAAGAPWPNHDAALWPAVVSTYAKKGLDEAHALTQARAVRVLRACDYDFTNRRPILWEPSNAAS